MKTPYRMQWRRQWSWPWARNQPNAVATLLGLRRMRHRVERCHVWRHDKDDKHSPALEDKKGKRPRMRSY